MTACSNHPATVAGDALRDLLAAHERLRKQLEALETACCESAGISRAGWQLLTSMDRSGSVPVASDELLGTLIKEGQLSVSAGPPTLAPRGRDTLARVDRLRFAALDTWASDLDAAGLRTTAATLDKLAQRVPRSAGG